MRRRAQLNRPVEEGKKQMELKEFIAEALAQIAGGVVDAQDRVRSGGGFVNPTVRGAQRDGSLFAYLPNGQYVFLVDFDVAISASSGTGTNAGAKLSVVSLLSLNAGGQSIQSQETISRVRFKVPLALPVDPESKAEMLDREQKEREEEEARKRGRPHGPRYG